MRIRSYITISFLLILAFMLTGCESVNSALFSSQGMEKTVSDKIVTINYYTWERTEQNNPVISEFTKENPNIRVNVQLVPDDANSAMEKLDIMALGGGDMDVWPLNSQYFRMKKGMLRSIDDYIKRDGIDMEKSFGAAATNVTFDGKYYGLPFELIVPMIFYNKDMFDQAGIPYPTNNWTCDDLYNISKKLTKGQGKNKIYGYMENWFLTVGGRPGSNPTAFYTKDGLSSFSDNSYWRRTLEFRKKMIDAGYEMPYDQVKSKGTYSSVEFLNGRAAMTMGASWVVRDMKDKQNFPFDFKVGCVLPPRLDSSTENIDQISFMATMLGIPVTSKHPEEAWKFIRFYAENGSYSIAKTGNMPVFKPAYSQNLIDVFTQDSGLSTEDTKQFFFKSTYEFWPTGSAATEYSEIFRDENALYFTGKQSLETTMKNIKQKADKAIIEERAELKKKKGD